MLSKPVKAVTACVVTIAYFLVFCVPTALAQSPTVKLIVNPQKTDVTIGADPIALTAKASGANLKYKWSLTGPGKIDGEGAAVFYILPDSVNGKSEQAVVTVTVTDGKNQETTDAFTFNILAKDQAAPAAKPATAPVPETKKGMSTGMMIGLGIGGAALIGGVAAMAAGGDSGDDNKPANVAGTWRLVGQATKNTCNLKIGSGGFNGTMLFNQNGSAVTTPRIYMTIGGITKMDFVYRGTVTKKSVSMAAVDPYVLRDGNTVFHLGSGIEIQNIKDNKSGTGSLNVTGSIVGTGASCQTIWSGTWTKQ